MSTDPGPDAMRWTPVGDETLPHVVRVALTARHAAPTPDVGPGWCRIRTAAGETLYDGPNYGWPAEPA